VGDVTHDGEAIVRRLYLLRHAKSSWDDAGVADRDRPLAPRGRKAMKAMARHLRHERIHPDLVLCSSARRARETLDRVRSSLGGDARIEVEDELYTFDDDVVLRRLRRLAPSFGSVMVVGHNPAMEELTACLAKGGKLVRQVEEKFPTGALAVLMIPSEWSRLEPGTADLESFVTPRSLS
jgi:phosphohistidine phosphatase